MTPRSEWQTPECVLRASVRHCLELRKTSNDEANFDGKLEEHGEEDKKTHKLIKTSPAPGSGMSSSSIFVEMDPGLS